jgi:hypothetical protein
MNWMLTAATSLLIAPAVALVAILAGRRLLDHL